MAASNEQYSRLGWIQEFVSNVQHFGTVGQLDSLIDYVNKSKSSLVENVAHLDEALGLLDLQQHCPAVIAILCRKFATGNRSLYDVLLVQVEDVVENIKPDHARIVGSHYSLAELCHLYTQALVERREAMRGLEVLSVAIRKIQTSLSQLTSVHSDICQLALLAKCMKPALVFLDADITEIFKEQRDSFDAKYFLLYYYYGGMIYTAVKRYDRALYFFEVAITTPSMAVSHIMLEAYKKHQLVSLILHGKINPLPRYTSQVVTRFIKPLSQSYVDFTTAYATYNPDEVLAVIHKKNDVFTRDNNVGLVMQCLASLYKKNIQRLTKTFLTLSLSDMANRVKLSGPQEAERYVLNMIEEGEIFASINQRDGMVVFHDNPEKYNTPVMFKKLEEQMRRCIQLNDTLRDMDEKISLEAEYIRKSAVTQEEDQPAVGTSKMQLYP